MSTVFYRWGAGRDESRVTFDGTHISVFDLKREIILGNRMGNGRDFDIAVYDNVTGEGVWSFLVLVEHACVHTLIPELKDDNHQIPRSSSLVARRLPPSARGRGNAQNYIVGTSAGESLTGDHRQEQHAKDALLAKQNRGVRGAGGTYGSLTKRFDGKEDKPEAGAPAISTGNAEEDARIKQMFQQQEDQWEHDLDELSQYVFLSQSRCDLTTDNHAPRLVSEQDNKSQAEVEAADHPAAELPSSTSVCRLTRSHHSVTSVIDVVRRVSCCSIIYVVPC